MSNGCSQSGVYLPTHTTHTPGIPHLQRTTHSRQHTALALRGFCQPYNSRSVTATGNSKQLGKKGEWCKVPTSKRGPDHRLNCSMNGASNAVSTSLLPSPKGSRMIESRHTSATHITPWDALLGHALLACAHTQKSHAYILLGRKMFGFVPPTLHPIGITKFCHAPIRPV